MYFLHNQGFKKKNKQTAIAWWLEIFLGQEQGKNTWEGKTSLTLFNKLKPVSRLPVVPWQMRCNCFCLFAIASYLRAWLVSQICYVEHIKWPEIRSYSLVCIYPRGPASRNTAHVQSPPDQTKDQERSTKAGLVRLWAGSRKAIPFFHQSE